MKIYGQNNLACSKITTQTYSTSFSLGVRLFHKDIRAPIYAIYGFVRFADEIVDSFFAYPQKYLFEEFKSETFKAIERGISTNPIIHSFQWVVNKYNITIDLIQAFLHSMEMDLHQNNYDTEDFQSYVYGSAEVVGLMCLHVFCNGEKKIYDQLTYPARKLGEAFQKVNFLRDIESDFEDRGRIYFPNIPDFYQFNEHIKDRIIDDIDYDLGEAFQGIINLPKKARLGVYLAYLYYINLLKKIKKTPAESLAKKRVRISNGFKLYLLALAWLRSRFNLI